MKERLLGLVRPLFANRTYTARHGLAKGLRRRGGFGFVPRLGPEEPEVEFLRGLVYRGLTVCDIGGYEGVFAIFFARAVGPGGRVVVFEPNPDNLRRIRDNVGLNGFRNVEIVAKALGREQGQAELVFDPGLAGVGSIRREIAAKLSEEGQAKRVTVAIDTLDNQIATHGRHPPDLVKIDVEGFELEVLKGMGQTIEAYHPALFVELHDAYLDEDTKVGRQVVELLAAAGYRMHHVEKEREVTGTTAAIPELGHLYCTGTVQHSRTAT